MKMKEFWSGGVSIAPLKSATAFYFLAGTWTRDWGTPGKDRVPEAGVPSPVNGQSGINTLPSLILWNAGGKK